MNSVAMILNPILDQVEVLGRVITTASSELKLIVEDKAYMPIGVHNICSAIEDSPVRNVIIASMSQFLGQQLWMSQDAETADYSTCMSMARVAVEAAFQPGMLEAVITHLIERAPAALEIAESLDPTSPAEIADALSKVIAVFRPSMESAVAA